MAQRKLKSQENFGRRFKALAAKLLPEHEELQQVSDWMSANEVDDYIFDRSEYLGGMAAALTAMLEKEGK